MTESIQQLLARVSEILARAEKSTPGPWIHSNDIGHIWACDAPASKPLVAVFDGFTKSKLPYDAEFIAAARSDIPALCKAVQELAKQYSELVDAICSPSWLGRERHESVLALARRLREKQAKLYPASDGPLADCLGTCETPHFLGEPTADRKALTQVPHYPLPQNQCKNWTPLPSPPQEKP